MVFSFKAFKREGKGRRRVGKRRKERVKKEKEGGGTSSKGKMRGESKGRGDRREGEEEDVLVTFLLL